MGDVKIQLKLGAVEFSGEGDQDWLAKQLDKILEKAPKLAAIAPSLGSGTSHNPMAPDPTSQREKCDKESGKEIPCYGSMA